MMDICILNTDSEANQTEMFEFGVEKGHCRAIQGECWLVSKKKKKKKENQTPQWFWGKVFRGKIWDESAGCVTFFCLVGSEVTG